MNSYVSLSSFDRPQLLMAVYHSRALPRKRQHLWYSKRSVSSTACLNLTWFMVHLLCLVVLAFNSRGVSSDPFFFVLLYASYTMLLRQ